jgi:hypothetical protein
VARHRSPRGRGAHHLPALAGLALAAEGGAHRAGPAISSAASSAARRRGLLAAGGIAAVLGQTVVSQVAEDDDRWDRLDRLSGFATAEAGAPLAPGRATASLVGELPRQRSAPGAAVTGMEELRQADVDSLVKAAGLAEAAQARQRARDAAKRLERQRLADTPAVRAQGCPRNVTGLSGVKPWVGTAGSQLRCIFDVSSLGGVGSRPNASDHPQGLAIDFMVGRGTGDKLADYVLKYRDAFKVKYVIYRQRINFGSGWKAMEDRGSPTANHMDHVHVSFDR